MSVKTKKSKGKRIYQSAQPVGSIDRDKKIIYGVSVITGDREAKGHEMFIDDITVDQVVSLGKEADKGVGLKARFDHPSACFSSMGTQLGRFKNFRKEGNKAIADLHLLDSNKEHTDFVMDLAKEDPDMFATSIVFVQDEPETFDPEDHPEKEEDDPFFFPHARLKSLMACDVVDEGAANDGLFGNGIFGRPDYWAEQLERFSNDNPELLEPILEPLIKSIIMKMNKKDSKGKKEVSSIEKLSNKISELRDKIIGNKTSKKDEGKVDYKAETKRLKEKVNKIIKEKRELKKTNDKFQEQLSDLTKQVDELSKIKLSNSITDIADQDKQDPDDNDIKKSKSQKLAEKKRDRKSLLADELQKEINKVNGTVVEKN